jgi:hypothetical protein
MFALQIDRHRERSDGRAAGDRAGPRAMELYGEVVAVKGAC